MKNLSDECYTLEFVNVVNKFKRFYPSDIAKMMVDVTVIDSTVIGRNFNWLIRDGIIERTGNTKKIKNRIEYEYRTVL